MKKNTKLLLLQSIGKIYEEAKGSKFEDTLFSNIDKDLTYLADYFGTNKIQAFLISIIHALYLKNNSVYLKEIVEYIECNPTKIYEFHDDLEILIEQRIIIAEKEQYSRGRRESYRINEMVTNAILENKPMPEALNEKIEDNIQWLETVYNFIQYRSDEKISTRMLFVEFAHLMRKYQDYPLVKKIKSNISQEGNQILISNIIWQCLNGRKSLDLETLLGEIYDKASLKYSELQDFVSENNELLNLEWVVTEESFFVNETRILLTDKSYDMLKEIGLKIKETKKVKESHITTPEEIVSKELIFEKNEMHQLSMIKNLLQEDKLEEIQNRLTEKGLPRGLAILLHGAPGTGKTEIVKQIAKETNRDIIKVEISQSKSMWYGGSEKIIKSVFTDYYDYAKECERTPILFFNEADAIINKRKDSTQTSIDNTENTIQNILLEELENFEGILFATTNLVSNMDFAFERRFLFKVEFKKPNIVTKTKIWKLKLPFLSEEECKSLASIYNFSGGQIDNVVRKNEIDEIIYGQRVSFKHILKYCDEETFAVKRQKIGFYNHQTSYLCQKENQ
jgi:SpoVK/Ycf46/Vps4 family AAA+-type ATPase